MTERDATADDGCKSPGDARYPSSPDAADALSRALVRHCADVITVRDAAGARRYVSPAVERVLGYRPEELVGAEALGAIHPDDAARVRAVWTACLAAPGGHVRVTYRARHRDGTWRVLEGTCTNLLHDPAVGGVVINARDVTARLAAEEARRAAERRYRALVERLPAAVYVNPIGDGPVARYISPQFAALTGYTAEEWMADPRFGRAILHAEDRERVLAAGTRSVATGAPFTEEYRYRRKDGTFVWVRDEAVVLRDEAGRPQCWQGLLLDITAQKEAEAALRAGEARLRTQYQALPLPTYTWQRRGDDFVFVDYNAAGDAFARGTLAAKLGQPASDIYRDLPAVAAHLARCCAERRTLQHDLRFAGRDLIITHVSVAPDLVVMHSEDVTERRRAQAALAASEADFRYLFAHNPHPMWVYDVETLAFLEVNDAAVALYGYARDEFLALSIADIRPPEERPDLDANLAEARGAMQTSGPWAHRTKDGRALAVEIAARALAYGGRAARLVVAQDVSARLAAEAALRAEERRARDLRAAAERQARELALLDRVRTALAGPLDPPGIHQAVVQATAGVFAGTQVSLYLRDGDELVRQEITGVAGGASARFARISVARGIMGRVARTGVPALLEDVAADPEFIQARDDVVSEVCVPLTDRGRVVGVLNAESRGGVRLGGADLRLLTAIGHHTSIALERARLYAEARAGAERLAAAEAIAHLGSWEYDAVAGALRWSDEVYRIFGHAPWAFAPTLERYEAQIHPDDRALVRAAWAALREAGRPYALDHRIVRPDGAVRVCHQRAEARPGAAGRPARLVGAIQDVTERRALEAQLAHQANHDALTGLPNRALFLDRLAQALRHARRRPGYRFAVLYLDLDRFKTINDSLGHAAGDALLAAMARRLEGCLRAGDTVARLGGDEFAVLLDDLEGGAVATEVAERLIAASQQPFVLAGHEVYTAASVGVVLGPDAYRQTEEVLRDADTAMYRAKAAGKGRHAVFAPAMHAHALAILQLEHDLRRALAQEEFRLHYQPIVALATGRLRGFEALVRWQHPARGLVSPGAFIPVAEETGLIVPLGWWVLEAACRQARAWQGAYPDAPLTMSVNLSARQLTQPDLVERVARALAASGLPGARLRLELTESAIMENAVVAAGVLARLRELGVQLAVDDFGTGYSSLAYLKRFPLDTLKVDKAFVDGLGTDPNDTAIVRAIVSLAHTLGLEVTAEGVETAEQIAQLRALGCGLAQGYHFGQPLAAEAAEALLARAQPGDAPPAAAGPGPTPSTGELRLRRTARDRRLLPTAASEQR